jgi:hypothetical protein
MLLVPAIGLDLEPDQRTPSTSNWLFTVMDMEPEYRREPAQVVLVKSQVLVNP